MAYATTTQIQIAAGGAARYVQLFDWDADGVADATVVAQIQAEVDAWIDSYAGRRFAVPISSPTQALTLAAAEEVVYRALVKRGMAGPDHVQLHEVRRAWLKDLADGRVVPSDPPPARASTVTTAWVERDTDDVSREGLKGFW